MKIASVADVKARFSAYLKASEQGPVVVTRNGKPAAMLVSYADYERLKETLDVLSDPELMRQIRASEAHFAAGKKGLTFEDVFGEPLVPVRRKRKTRK